MAKRRVRGKIAIRTDRITIVHPVQEPVSLWCPVCRSNSSMVVPEEAARRRSIDIRTIYRWIETGTIHVIEVSEGILVCLNSIHS